MENEPHYFEKRFCAVGGSRILVGCWEWMSVVEEDGDIFSALEHRK